MKKNIQLYPYLMLYTKTNFRLSKNLTVKYKPIKIPQESRKIYLNPPSGKRHTVYVTKLRTLKIKTVKDGTIHIKYFWMAKTHKSTNNINNWKDNLGQKHTLADDITTKELKFPHYVKNVLQINKKKNKQRKRTQPAQERK